MIPSAHVEAARRELPATRVEMFSRSGHFPHLDEPDRFAAVLRDFASNVGITPVLRCPRRQIGGPADPAPAATATAGPDKTDHRGDQEDLPVLGEQRGRECAL